MQNQNIVKNNNSEKGQVLLFIIVAMTIVLALGVGVSMDTLTSITQVSTTDTSQRALAAAEGGVEKFLTLENEQLKILSDLYTTNDYSNEWQERCNEFAGVNAEPVVEGTQGMFSGCRVTYINPNTANDPIQAKAVVTVEEYRYNVWANNGNARGVGLVIPRNDVGEVLIEGVNSPIEVCWNPQNVIDLYLIGIREGSPYAVNKVFVPGCGNNNFCSGYTISQPAGSFPNSPNPGSFPYTRCVGVRQGDNDNASDHIPSNTTHLRIRPLFRDGSTLTTASVGVFPRGAGQELPVQGYKITSVGSLIENNAVTVTRTVTVYKSHPMPIGLFDFSIYAGNDLKSVL